LRFQRTALKNPTPNVLQLKAVIVENTFTSIEDVAPRLFPLLGLFIGPSRCDGIRAAVQRLDGSTSTRMRLCVCSCVLECPSTRQPAVAAAVMRPSWQVAPSFHNIINHQMRAGRFFNFLVRNKWESKRDVRHLASLPVLLLSSLRVRGCNHVGSRSR